MIAKDDGQSTQGDGPAFALGADTNGSALQMGSARRRLSGSLIALLASLLRRNVSCAPFTVLGVRLAILLMAFTVMRGLFLFLNWDMFGDARARDLVFAMIHGLRFDLSALLLLNAIFILLEVGLPTSRLHQRRWFRGVYESAFLLLNMAALAVEAIDIEGFKFFGRRSSLGMLSMMDDIEQQALQLVTQFWYIALIAAALFVVLGWAVRRAHRWGGSLPCHSRSVSLASWMGLGLGALALTTLGIRGGLQAKPLSTAHAFTRQSTMLGALSLNTTFNAIHNKPGNDVRPVNYFAQNRDLRAILGEDEGLGRRFPASRDNVVVIILEGFSLEHIGMRPEDPTYAPFFSSLASQGLYFPKNHANGRRSMEAVSSILAGFPSLMEEPYISSAYSGNELHGLASILGERGYATHFFHGAKDGSMFIDSMARLVGFDHYHGMAEYPHRDRDFDGNWGIADEPFLQYTVDKLDTLPQPFLAGIFTLSAHNPYTIPQQHFGRFPRGTNPIHESLGYSDYALQRFFAHAAQQSWYRNTLFVLTADHTASMKTPRFRTELGLYRVPLLFFHPGGKVPQRRSGRITQHADVMPSILDFLGVEPASFSFRPLPFGRSVFDERFEGRVVNQTSGKAWMIKGDRIVWLQGDQGQVSIEGLDPDGLRARPADVPVAQATQLRDEMCAYLQTYKNGLIRNEWYR